MTLDLFTGKVAAMSGTQFNLVTNRAASAIHLALTTFAPSGVFLVPSNICLSPIMAGKIANYEVKFVGTDKFQLDLREVIRHLETNRDVNAILLPELYGYPIANIELFWTYIKDRDILIIEDLAQSLGRTRVSRFGGKPTVVTIYSFGPTKIIDSVRCGVLSTNNENLFLELEAKLLSLEKNSLLEYELASRVYNSMYIELLSRDEVDRDWPNFYGAASKLSSVLFTPRFPTEGIPAGFSFDETSITQIRNERHARLVELFKGFEQITLPQEVELMHPVWRTTIRMDQKKRDSVVNKLRYAGSPVSTWYKAMHRMFQDDESFPTNSLEEAVRFENEVVNIFLNVPNFEEYFKSVQSAIRESLS
jgi:dTDP-4-amino-4,6-dideoxygalactose transaminase